MKSYVVYQAYGNVAILHELLYSIYSLLRLYPGRPQFGIMVYTDNQTFLTEKLPGWVTYRPLSPDEIKTWAGPNSFVHRVKIMTLLDFVDNHQGKLLYVDTDTVFTQPIEPLFAQINQQSYVMHVGEGPLSSPGHLLFRKISAFLTRNPHLKISTDTIVYNAGVLGLPCVDRATLEHVLNLTDELYAAYPKHIMEQLAFSAVLASHNPIAEAREFVYHYWNFKEFRSVLSDFFAFNTDAPYAVIAAKIDQIDPRKLIQPKTDYEQLPFWQKAFRKLKKERWVLPPYTLS